MDYTRSFQLRRGLLFVLVFLLLLIFTAVAAGQPAALNADERVYPTLPRLAPEAALAPGGQPLPAPRAADVALPAWGSMVYYARGQGNWDLYINDRGNMEPRRLTSGPTLEVQPDLRRGGDLIVYAADNDGDFDLYTMPAAGGASYKLLDTPADENMPVWSPDGRRIAFQSMRDGNSDIYVVDGNGQNLHRLTSNPDFDGHPSWSPDGTKIAFSSRQEGAYRIWVMDAGGGNKVQLSAQPGSLYPAWSPDGTQIAYSADGDYNGWLDLWMMSATGENQRQLKAGGATVDFEVRGWWPDGQAITLTQINYVQYQGEWYILNTYLAQWDMEYYGHLDHMNGAEYPFGPAAATHDTIAPTSSLQPLPAVSSAWLTIRWSAADSGGSGLATTIIEMSTDGGPWSVWQTNPEDAQLSFRGVGGKKYYFRIRAIDKSLNVEPWPAAPDIVTTVEALPPVTTVEPLPEFSRATDPLTLTWRGVDPGGSGITQYRVQFRRGSGAWQPWLENVYQTSAVFDPATHGVASGEALAFRIRAVDAAQNVEPWPADPGSATTTTYAHAITGRLIDNTGTPVGGAAVTSTPALMGPGMSDGNGAFGRYVGAPVGVVSLSWAKDGYGALPLTPFEMTADAALVAALPPVGDAVAGGDFEAVDWGAWTPGGDLMPTLSGAARNTGAQGAQLAAQPPAFAPAEMLTNDPANRESLLEMSVYRDTTTLLWLSDFNTKVWEARRTPAGEWLAPRLLFSDVGEGGFVAATGSDGRLHVVARRETGLHYRSRNADGSWTAAELIAGSYPGYSSQLYIGPDNALHLFWRNFGPGIDEIRYSRRAPAGGWSAPVTVASATGDEVLLYNAAAVKPSGALEFVYYLYHHDQYEGDRRLLSRERRTDGTWASPVLIESMKSTTFHVVPQPVAGPDGRVHLMWERSISLGGSQNKYEVVYAVKSGGSWSTPQRVYEMGWPEWLGVGADGVVHAIANVQPVPGMAYMALGADGVWSQPQPVPGAGYATPLLGSDGQIHVLRDPGNEEYAHETDLTYVRRSASGVWSEPVNLSFDEQHHHSPAAALDPGGNVHVGWLVKKDKYTHHEGDVAYAGPTAAPAAGQATLSQTVTIPAGAAHPVLSFFYRFGGAVTAATRLELVVGDAQPVALPLAPGEMRHHWVDLTGRSGDVAVTFRLTQAAGQPAAWAAVDDVSLGGAVGDAWVSVGNATSMPGRQVTHVVTVGNRGGVAGGPVVLAYDLPPEMSFVSADPAPKSTSPLRWEWPTLAAGETRAVRVVVAVSPSAALPGTLYASAEVTMPGELETHNNAAVGGTRLESAIVLPVILR